MKNLRSLPLLCLALTTMGGLLAGCGSSGAPNEKVEQARMDDATQMRNLFDKAGGEYSKLDAADKATFEKLSGGAAHAEETWNRMKNGPSASSGPAH